MDYRNYYWNPRANALFYSFLFETAICNNSKNFFSTIYTYWFIWVRTSKYTRSDSIFTAIRRNYILAWIFFCLVIICIFTIASFTFEYLDIVHILPNPPIRPTTKNDKLPLNELQVATPLNAIKPVNSTEITAKTAERAKKVAETEVKTEAKKKNLSDSQIASSFLNKIDPYYKIENKKIKSFLESQPADAVKEIPKAGEPSDEEISIDELPKDTGFLSYDSFMSVSANTKTIKRCYDFYAAWITFAYAYNKCISFDVLEELADQFDPLLANEDNILKAKDLDL